MKHEITSQNTKKMLVDTLIQLLHKKPLSKITVSEIVNTCQINRKTFYYHFTDIYDLLEWHLNEKIQETLDAFNLLEDLEAVLDSSRKFIEKNTYMINCADDPIGSEQLVQFFYKKISPLVFDIIGQFEQQRGKYLEEGYKHFLADIFAKSSALFLVDTIKSKINLDYQQYSVYLSDTFQGALEGILCKMEK